MIFFVPIVPILIAIVVLILSITTQVASSVEIITTVGWVLVIGSSSIMVVWSVFRDTSFGDKIASIIISIISSILSLIESRAFFQGLLSTDTNNLFGTIEFLFVLVFGGSIWLATVGLASYANLQAVYDYDYEGAGRYIKCVGAIIGSIILASIFGFFSYS